MSRSLDVYLGLSKAGVLSQDDDGNLSFGYSPDHLLTKNARAISVSMPHQEAPYPDRVTRPFFSGLLPDEGARQKLAAVLGISADNAFGMLEIIGGECAGALSLYPAGRAPAATDENTIEMLSPARLAKVLEKLRDRPLLGGEEGVRLSLAGAQDKLAICLDGDAIALAKGGRPTTHILKPFIQTLDGTVENELFCMRLAVRMKLNAPDVRMQKAGNIPFLLVKRYDRKLLEDGTIERLHQEDLCPGDGRAARTQI